MDSTRDIQSSGFKGRKAFIVSLRERGSDSDRDTGEELVSLCRTLGLDILERLVVPVGRINPATYIGKGKLEELKSMAEDNEAGVMVFGCELTPVQQRNIEGLLGISVIDRNELILYIFGAHAKTKEGKLQVELAHLNYILPRLTGRGIYLSRLGGGVGTRGPGEMKLEVHRRRIKERIHRLKKELEDVEKHRRLIRHSRRRKRFPYAVIVGYTNVGKSSLLNRLSSSDLHVANKLFSTLDPATRSVYLGSGRVCLLSDTVGLLKDIPHHLIEAFKSTLEELNYADLLVCLYDLSATSIKNQRDTVAEVLKELHAEDAPRIDVFNKADLLNPVELNLLRREFPRDIFISVKTGMGVDDLKAKLGEKLYENRPAPEWERQDLSDS